MVIKVANYVFIINFLQKNPSKTQKCYNKHRGNFLEVNSTPVFCDQAYFHSLKMF
ncbi:hypothetical protein H1P_2970007 [Hyella patelloides LEGE 07179]|uniref:Uncharacterized protein n=1 Tax=Hyella patelloides LEGE 07179 TaxID=945734 RepID=A0A563VTY5_9CYAN|nr:hypothetical protein H1P_2970007 [Hyella patelloides LEGE 07179]